MARERLVDLASSSLPPLFSFLPCTYCRVLATLPPCFLPPFLPTPAGPLLPS